MNRDQQVKAITEAVLSASKGQGIPREQAVKNLVDFIAKTRWEDKEIHAIYQAARNKCLSKTCYLCGKPQPVFGGEWLWPDGDMSKPKKFRCADCRGLL